MDSSDAEERNGLPLFISLAVILPLVAGVLHFCCRSERVSRAGAPQSEDTTDEATLSSTQEEEEDLRRTVIEAALITRKVVSVDSPASSGRLGRMVDSLSSSGRTYSSFVAALSKIGNRTDPLNFQSHKNMEDCPWILPFRWGAVQKKFQKEGYRRVRLIHRYEVPDAT